MASSNHAQKFVPIKEIRDGVVTLQNGGMRGVLLVSAINLALKSANEQEATIMQFQNFLNTLDFSIEIVAQSRRMDIRPYLELLDARLLQQKEELLRVQTRMYIEYIKAFTEEFDIMKKHFLVVVPYSAALSTARKKNIIDRIFSPSKRRKKKMTKSETSEETFEEKRTQLEQRLAVVRQGLMSVGLSVDYLNTEALIDLYYGLYNPGDTQKTITGTLLQ